MHASFLLLFILGISAVDLTADALAETGNRLKYTDSKGRFIFHYPEDFGTPLPGTNNGFGRTAASIRFSDFSSGVRKEGIVLGGEATLTQGFVLVDLQALGGLYDSLTLEAFPEPLRGKIVSSLIPLAPSNFCSQLGMAQHVDFKDPTLAALTARQKDALTAADQIRNITPQVHRCDLSGDLIIFDKETSFDAQQPSVRQHVYGVIRFLPAPYSSFQLVRATRAAPAAELLAKMAEVAKSLVIASN